MEITGIGNKKEVLDHVNDCDFIANVLTSWHYEVITSYLQNQSEGFDNGTVFLIPQSNIQNESSIRVKDDLLVEIEDKHIRYVRTSGFDFLATTYYAKKELVSLLLKTIFSSKGKEIHFFSPGKVNIRSLFNFLKFGYRRINCVIYDEGTASYLSDTNHHLIVNKFLGKHQNSFIDKIKIQLKYKLKDLIILFLQLIGILKIQKYFAFEKREGKLFPQRQVVSNLKHFYESKYEKNALFEENILILKDFDEKIIPVSEIVRFYQDLISQLQIEQEKIYIKKHPNDLNEDFDKEITALFPNIEIIKTKISAEALVAGCKPKLLIGGISTSAFTLPFIFKITSYNYILLYKKFTLDKDYSNRLEKFYSYFNEGSDLIEFIQ